MKSATQSRGGNMKRKLAFALIALAAFAAPGVAKADVVTDWNRTMIDALETAHTPPPPAMRAAAIVQSSVFDALNGVEKRYTPVHVQPAAPPGASRRAAVVGAAYEALVGLFPSQQATFDAELQVSLAEIGGGPNDQSVARGLAWGKQVADEILTWRAGDGFTAVLPPYVPGGAPGDWQPTPPLFGPPLFRQFAIMTPFALTSPSQFLPAGPPALTSARYTQDFNEVKALGSTTSVLRTPFQTETAKFWAGDTPAAIFNRVADDLADANHTTLTQNARLLARMNVALADAVIGDLEREELFRHVAPNHRHPAGVIGRQSRHDFRPKLGPAAHDAAIPGVSGGASGGEQRRGINARVVLRRCHGVHRQLVRTARRRAPLHQLLGSRGASRRCPRVRRHALPLRG